MKKAHKSNRGQVLIIFVFAIIGLIGITGLAIDGSNTLSERRRAQNGADTAALAGALAKINGQKANSSWKNADCIIPNPLPANINSLPACAKAVYFATRDRAETNGYTGLAGSSNSVEVYLPPISGPYSNCAAYNFDCRDYVQVFITNTVDTYFAKILGIAQTHNRVEAVALARYAPESSLFGGNSLIELKPHGTSCSGEFYVSGTSNVILTGGGIFVNSDNTDCAWKYPSSCPNITLNGGAKISVVGSVDPKNSTCTSPVLPISHPTDQYPFPPEPLFDEPVECNIGGSSYNSTDGVHYRPGYYNELPPENDVTLDPGAYCVEKVIKSTNPTKMRGNGVFLYVRDSNQATAFSFNGGTVNLTAPTSGIYKGYLIYVAENDYVGTPKNCNINGGSDDSYTGVIFAPYCDVTINGQSGTLGLTAQVAAYTLSLTGNATINFIFDPDQMPKIPEIRYTGLYR